MMVIQIHRLNASISLFLALCLNAILILLVVKRSPKEMKVYKRILLQTAIVDIALSVLSFLSQDVSVSTNRWVLVLSVSQFSDYLSISPHFGTLLIDSWIIVQFFSLFGLCVQFIYRFLVLNRGLKITLKQYIAMLSFVFSIAILTWTYDFIVSNDHINLSLLNAEEIFQIEQLLGGNLSGFVTYCEANNYFPVQISMWACFIENIICYATIVICGYKMARFVHQNLDQNSTRKQQINRQITINLISQAFIPLAMNIIYIILTAQLLIFEFELSPIFLFVQMCASIPLHWLPVLNPLVSIFCVGDYRNAVLNFVQHTICRRPNAVAQQQTPMNNLQNNNPNAQLPIVA